MTNVSVSGSGDIINYGNISVSSANTGSFYTELFNYGVFKVANGASAQFFGGGRNDAVMVASGATNICTLRFGDRFDFGTTSSFVGKNSSLICFDSGEYNMYPFVAAIMLCV